MSQFCTMTTSERKFLAAAICRAVQGQEDLEIDLGKKVSAPKDIMLEELSLASNRGSRLFKMRQRRSEKYTFESIQNTTNIELNSTAISQTVEEQTSEIQSSETNCAEDDSTATRTAPDPETIAPGYGGPMKDLPPEKFNSTAIPKSYHSPWHQAIVSDPALADTLTTRMPDPEQQPDRPVYKCFNRVATPFGGFARTSSPVPPPARSLPVDVALPDFPELQAQTAAAATAPLDRPSFNRAASGWVSSNQGPAPIINLSQPDFIPESDDL
ncbi:myozenin-2a [Boleophthalmus pectinirostris]|uniref:myozenin-2a n=1 Tax=Boleophthalmus pectinirostris TaxID=150288 RepID=UPI002432E5C1|nr:myozenin-2a [Boleophthalmus pectinirostris]